MGIEDPKIRLFVLFMINLIVILGFRYWVLNNEAFVWLLNGLPSWINIEGFDSIFRNTVESGVQALIPLAIVALLLTFFLAFLKML